MLLENVWKFLLGGNNMRIRKCIKWAFISLVLVVAMVIFDLQQCPWGCSITNILGILLGLCLPVFVYAVQDAYDKEDWKISQRHLERANVINEDTDIRISFAYLFRIKIGNDYLLVKNERGTNKFQPVGGVYKFKRSEKRILQNTFHAMDDDKVKIDESSRNDYRLRVKNKYLRKFVKHFDTKAERENVTDLSREFKEELIDTGILNWDHIDYRYCGRHISDLHFSKHFQISEVLLADIVELKLTDQQEADLRKLANTSSDQYRFANAAEIRSLGVNVDSNQLEEVIGDHTVKILEESEANLRKATKTGNIYHVNLR